MWKAYIKKFINQGLQIIDKDFESDDEDEIRENWAHQPNEEDIPSQDQQRRLGLDNDMIGAREENLGSTRSQTLEMRSPSNESTERANINRDNWIQEIHYISVVTSDPDEPNNFNEASNHQSPNERRNGEKQLQKNYIIRKTKSLESHI